MVTQFNVKRLSWPPISPIQDSETEGVTSQLLQSCRNLPNVSLLSCPTQNTAVTCMTEGQGGAGRIATRAQNITKIMDIANHFMDSEPAMSFWE